MRKYISKILSVFLLVSISMSLIGCSDIMKDRCKIHIEETINSFLESTKKSPMDAFKKNSKTEIEFPELDDTQKKMAVAYCKTLVKNCSISNIEVEDKRKAATATLTINDCFVYDENIEYIGMQDEINALIKKSKANVTVTIKLIRESNEWYIEDLTPLVDSIFVAYSNVCVLGEDGFPLSMSQKFVDNYANENFVDVLWYDPLKGDPIKGEELNSKYYIQCVFYFNKPQTLDLTADLIYEGEVIMSKDIILKDDIIANCNFGYDLSQEEFKPGEYSIALNFRGFKMAQSVEATIR